MPISPSPRSRLSRGFPRTEVREMCRASSSIAGLAPQPVHVPPTSTRNPERAGWPTDLPVTAPQLGDGRRCLASLSAWGAGSISGAMRHAVPAPRRRTQRARGTTPTLIIVWWPSATVRRQLSLRVGCPCSAISALRTAHRAPRLSNGGACADSITPRWTHSMPIRQRVRWLTISRS